MKSLKNLIVGAGVFLSVLFLSSCSQFTFPAQGGVNPPQLTLSGDSLCVSFSAQGEADLKAIAESLSAKIPQHLIFRTKNEVLELDLFVDSLGVGHINGVSVTCVKVK